MAHPTFLTQMAIKGPKSTNNDLSYVVGGRMKKKATSYSRHISNTHGALNIPNTCGTILVLKNMLYYTIGEAIMMLSIINIDNLILYILLLWNGSS